MFKIEKKKSNKNKKPIKQAMITSYQMYVKPWNPKSAIYKF